MTQKENMRSQLAKLLLQIPDIGIAADRRAFFSIGVGLEHTIAARINWDGLPQTFIDNLLTQLVQDGREPFLRFLLRFDDASVLGTEQRTEMRRLIARMGQLSEEQWSQEFVSARYSALLEEGVAALMRGEYRQARTFLKNAVPQIASNEKRLAAKARYLQALALLGDERPRDKGIVVMEKISELLNAAISLDQCRTYVMTISVILDPSLQKQANSTRITDYDVTLLSYMKQCQPDLYHQICQVFGI